MSTKRKVRQWLARRAWTEKARAADTCCVYQCTGKNFPYCGRHDF